MIFKRIRRDGRTIENFSIPQEDRRPDPDGELTIDLVSDILKEDDLYFKKEDNGTLFVPFVCGADAGYTTCLTIAPIGKGIIQRTRIFHKEGDSISILQCKDEEQFIRVLKAVHEIKLAPILRMITDWKHRCFFLEMTLEPLLIGDMVRSLGSKRNALTLFRQVIMIPSEIITLGVSHIIKYEELDPLEEAGRMAAACEKIEKKLYRIEGNKDEDGGK